MAWSDAARQASILARQANARTQDRGIHQAGVTQVGKQGVSSRVLDVIRNSPSGFSVDLKGNTPTKGYMVAMSGRSQVLPGSALKGAGAQGLIESYANKNADVLRQPGAHIGGWQDSKSGKLYLDVAHNIPRARDAVKAGKERNQIAIWDVKRKREIRTGGTGE